MTGTREDWLAARLDLLEAEKEFTRRSDELARRRQDLPWVRIDKQYRFETDVGADKTADREAQYGATNERPAMLIQLTVFVPAARRCARLIV
jgi:predicted dithiol-disulfide oxidoreductase (DUF899 family)